MVLRVRVGVYLGRIMMERLNRLIMFVLRYCSFSGGLLSLLWIQLSPVVGQVRSSRTGGCCSDFDLENEAHMNIWVEDVIKVQSIIIIQSRADDIVQCTRQ